jgi:hypothetical protein
MDQIPDPYRDEPQFRPRHPNANPVPVPDAQLDYFFEEHTPALELRDVTRTLSERSAASTASVCGPKDTTGPCERPVKGSDTTMPIVVGTVVPITIAIIVLIFLHRRHVRNLRKEDMEDKHGSLDFGMGEGRRPLHNKSKRWKKQPPPPPEMTMADAKAALRAERGLSIDLGNNPYLLPAGLANSRESLHSMSRTANLGDDKYQRTNFIPDDGSIRSPSVRGMRRADDSSSFSGSTKYRNDAESSRSLIHGGNGLRPTPPAKAYSPIPFERTASPSPANLLAPSIPEARESIVSTTGNTAAFRASNNYLGSFIRGGAGSTKQDKPEDKPKQAEIKVTEAEVIPTPPEKEYRSLPPVLPAVVMNEEPLEHGRLSIYDDDNPTAPVTDAPQRPPRTASMPADREPQIPQFSVMDFDSQGTTPQDSREPSQYGVPQAASQEQSRAASGYSQYNQSEQAPGQHTHQDSQQAQQYQAYADSSYGQYDQSQPTTGQHNRQESQQPQQYQQYDDQDDYYDPEDTYSVYDEYEDYDQRRMTWGMRPLPPDDPSENPEQRANRIRSFYKEYFDESGKPGGGNVAQYYDGAEDYYDYYDEQDYHPPRGMSAQGGRHRAMSNGSYMSHGGPRAYSSASGQYGRRPPPNKRMPPKKRMPPPKALNVLPTPSALKDDTFLLDLAVDFAPPDRAKLQRAGTPDSRRGGGQRPYSPSVRAFTPLQSSYDDMAVLPSP